MLQNVGRNKVGRASERITRVVSNGDDLVDLRQLLVLLYERKGTVILFVLATLAAAFIYLVRAERIYTATATVALNTREEKVVDLAAVTSGLSTDYSTVMTELEVLTSRQLMRRVVRELKLVSDPLFNPSLAADADAPPGPVDWAKGFVRGGLQAARDLIAPSRTAATETSEGSSVLSPEDLAIDILLGLVSVNSEEFIPVFKISVRSPSAEKSAKIANAIAEMYIVNQLETKFEATAKATEWLSERVAQLKIRLEDAERKVEEFLSKSKLVSEDALKLRNKQLKDLRTRLAQIREDAAGAKTKLAAASPLFESGDKLGAAAALGERDIDLALAEHSRATGERKQVLEQRVGILVERELARLIALQRDGDEQARLLSSTVAEIEAETARQSEDLIELRQLQREADASRSLYEYFLTRQSETAVQKGIQQADSRVLSEAVVRTAPTSPRSAVTMLIAFFLGAFGGVSYVLITSTWDTRFKMPGEVAEATGLPLLGTVPVMRSRSRRKLFDHLLAHDNSDMSESLRNIRTSLQLSSIDNPPKIVMVTSSMPAEGKTSLSIGLALVAAATNKRVLIVECDMRRRVYGQYFDATDKAGLGALLLGETTLEEAVTFDQASGVHVLRTEKMPGSPADLFASDRFVNVIEAARKSFDFIVLDTPPILAVSDARMLARVADAVVFCVRWRKTTRAIVDDALELLTMHDVPVTGAVLTQVDRMRMAKYSYGGYGSYKAVHNYYRKA